MDKAQQEAINRAFDWISLHGYRQGNVLRQKLQERDQDVSLSIVDSFCPEHPSHGLHEGRESEMLDLVRELGVGGPVQRLFSMRAQSDDGQLSASLFFAATPWRIVAGSSSLLENDDQNMRLTVFAADQHGDFCNVDPAMTPAYGAEYPYLYHLGDFTHHNVDNFAKHALRLLDAVAASSDEIQEAVEGTARANSLTTA